MNAARGGSLSSDLIPFTRSREEEILLRIKHNVGEAVCFPPPYHAIIRSDGITLSELFISFDRPHRGCIVRIGRGA